MEPITLTEDVNKALSGNQKSYSNLYAYLAPILHKTIKRKIYGVSSHQTKDILQDIMLKIFLKLNTFKPGNSFIGWAISIAVHHTIDLSRKREPDVILTENVEIHDSGISESLVECFQYGAVPAIDVLDLSNKYLDNTSKSIIIGKYFAGLKQKELAEKLNKPIGSISGIQAHAIGELKRKISELRLERSDFK